MKREVKNPIGFYTIGIVGLFLAGFFLLVLFGANSYRATVALQNDSMDRRALLAYFAASVKARDAQGAIGVEDSEFGQVLVLCDGDYTLRIYRHDGKLLEDFAAADAPLSPADAQEIAATETFRVERESGLLTVCTDAGKAVLRLRSEGSEI